MSHDERDPLLAAFLAQYDVSCPNCDYNLRGLDKPRCPECGVALTVAVTLRSHASPGAASTIGPPAPSTPFPKIITIEVNPEAASLVRRVETLTVMGGLLGAVVVIGGVVVLCGWGLGFTACRPVGWSGRAATLVATAIVVPGWVLQSRTAARREAWRGPTKQHWVRLAAAWAWALPFACGWW
ncbi:MAG: hypothetical protein IT433_02200 [Phycisphaerales bacterium]|nr:hypothetical protein [Phycisphaerales bacterium]